jgi:predicted GH43/DUF377 family glycosyl hydrolase
MTEYHHIALLLAMVMAFNAPIRSQNQTTGKIPSGSQELQIYKRGRPEGPVPHWAIGPFTIGEYEGEYMIFRKELNWKDPAAPAGWKPGTFWNPTLIEKNGKLYLFYRTGPRLEGLESRIGLAWSEDGVHWQDYEHNPVIYPTEEYEGRGCEDPRIYEHEGRYYLYYNSVWDMVDRDLSIEGVWKRPDGTIGVDICLAISEDLLHWEKKGVIVPRSVSRNWAKAPVIPRSPYGEAVKLNGRFMMFISERLHTGLDDSEEQVIGYSTDLVHWQFEQKTFMEPDENIRSIYEVATAVTGFPGSNDLVFDVYYRKHDNSRGCAQVLYNRNQPAKKLAFSDFGLCTWGGMIVFRDQWLFAQGWVEPEAIYLYTSPIKRPWIKVEGMEAEKLQLSHDEKNSITIKVKNIGEVAGKREINIQMNGQPLDILEVYLGPDESTTLTYDISVNMPGRYMLKVDNEEFDFEVIALPDF